MSRATVGSSSTTKIRFASWRRRLGGADRGPTAFPSQVLEVTLVLLAFDRLAIAWLSGRTLAVALPVPFQETAIYLPINTVSTLSSFAECRFGIIRPWQSIDFGMRAGN